MSRIGADRMIELARDWAIRGASGAFRYLSENGAGEECGLALYLFEARDGALVRELPPIVEVDTPPMGAAFDLIGESFIVTDRDGCPFAFATGSGAGFFIPERLPVDAGTLSIEGDTDSSLPPF